MVILFIVDELDTWSQDLNTDFTLKDCLFGSVKITKYGDTDNNSYQRYGTGFDSRSIYSITNFDWDKNVIFRVDISSSVHIDNKGKHI